MKKLWIIILISGCAKTVDRPLPAIDSNIVATKLLNGEIVYSLEVEFKHHSQTSCKTKLTTIEEVRAYRFQMQNFLNNLEIVEQKMLEKKGD